MVIIRCLFNHVSVMVIILCLYNHVSVMVIIRCFFNHVSVMVIIHFSAFLLLQRTSQSTKFWRIQSWRELFLKTALKYATFQSKWPSRCSPTNTLSCATAVRPTLSWWKTPMSISLSPTANSRFLIKERRRKFSAKNTSSFAWTITLLWWTSCSQAPPGKISPAKLI